MKHHLWGFVFTSFFMSLLTLTEAVLGGDKNRQAEAAFDNAVKLFRDGYYEEASDEFRKANAVKPSYSLLYNIGQSEAAAKRYGLAYDAFEEYLSFGGDDITEERRKQVVVEMERLSKMIGSVEIVAPPGCTVFVDERERGITPLPGRIKLAVGVVHKIELNKDGERLYAKELKVSFGDLIREEISASPAKKKEERAAKAESSPKANFEKAFASSETEKENRNRPLRGVAIATMTFGGAMLVAASATGGVALSKNADIKEACNNAVCDGREKSAVRSRDAFALSTDILLGAGAAATIAGAILAVAAKKRLKRSETGGLGLISFISPEAAGFFLTGAF